MKGTHPVLHDEERREMRVSLQNFIHLASVTILLCLALPLYGQDDAQRSAIEKRIKEQFTFTKIKTDRSDIVTAGSVLVLHKEGLSLGAVEAKIPLTNTYKNGHLEVGFGATMNWVAQAGTSAPQRKFSDGEKFWITGVSLVKDGLLLIFYSDPYDDVRYYGQVKFPFAKGSTPTPEEMLKTIAEVVTVEGPAPEAPAPAAAAPAEAMAPIPPPPPPPDAPPPQPKTIALGQTKAQVVAIFGQPQKVANLGTKEIYYYPDMKVVLVKGKVSDIQ
jgi:hypothetical protein